MIMNRCVTSSCGHRASVQCGERDPANSPLGCGTDS
jgi:hypothetical protein